MPTGIHRVEIGVFGQSGTHKVEILVEGQVVAESQVILSNNDEEVIVPLEVNTTSLQVDVRLNGRHTNRFALAHS